METDPPSDPSDPHRVTEEPWPARRSNAVADAFAEFEGESVEPVLGSDDGRSRLGAWVGPYEILSTLGEGGFGTVYLARQHEPIRRDLAVKVHRGGLGSAAAAKRFDAERSVLARLEHPSIAAIFDAGFTDDRQPYFSMEHVDGPSITSYCREGGLSLRERLALFRDVCTTVEYAHQRGVLHRDLKPSNILVTDRHGAPLPKVIDFGIAKLLDEDREGGTVLTLTGQVLGTPEYMSPEQAAGDASQLDARCDVYSLGAVLYELLTGVLPLEGEWSAATPVPEILRVLCNVDPPRPSTRVTSGRGPASTADERRTWGLALRGDLDWVCLKALEKEPGRRYATPGELAEDVGRFLDERPVHASPPSLRHRAMKFARRHRALVGGTLAVFVVLVAGILATSLALSDARASSRRFDGLRLASEARAIARDEPTHGLLLALEAADRTRGAAVHDALYMSLAERAEEHVLYGHDEPNLRIAVSPTGDTVASWSRDPFVLVHDVESGERLRELRHSEARILRAAYSQRGDRLLVVDREGGAALWALDGSGTSAPDILVPPPAVDPSGRRISVGTFLTGDASVLVGCEDGVVRRFDTARGEWADWGLDTGADGGLSLLVLDATGTHVAAHGGGVLGVWRLSDGVRTCDLDDRLAAFENGVIWSLHADPRGPRFATFGDEVPHNSIVFDVEGRILHELPRCAARGFAPGSSTLGYSRDMHGPAPLHGTLDLETSERREVAGVPSGSLGLVLDEDAAIWTVRNALVRLTVTPEGGVERRWLRGHRYEAKELLVVPGSSRFVTTSADRTVRVWNTELETSPVRLAVRHVGSRAAMALGPDGPRVLGRVTADGPWSVVGLAGEHVELGMEGMRAEMLASGDQVLFLPTRVAPGYPVDDRRAFVVQCDREQGWGAARALPLLGRNLVAYGSPDGRTVIVQDSAQTSGERSSHWTLDPVAMSVEPLDLPEGHGAPFAFAAGRHRIAARRGSEECCVLDGPQHAVIGRSRGHGGDHLAYAFGPRGDVLLTAAVDRVALLRDVASGEVLARFHGLAGLAQCAGITDDGGMAWVQSPEAIDLIDANSGAHFARIEPHEGEFCQALTSADGRYLLAVTSTGWFQRFPLDPVAYGRAVAPRPLTPEELEAHEIGTPRERRERVRRTAGEIGTANFHVRAAAMWESHGDTEGRLALLEEGAALEPRDPGPWQALVDALCAKGEQARGDARRADVRRRVRETIRAAERCDVPRKHFRTFAIAPFVAEDPELAAWLLE